MKCCFKESNYTTGHDCICVGLHSSWILLDSLINSAFLLKGVKSILQSEFSAECDLVLLLSISNIPSFPQGHPVNAYVSLLRLPVTSILPSIYPSIACLRRKFLNKMWPIHLTFLLFILCKIFLSKFHRPKNLCSKCSTLLVSSLNTSPFCRRKKPSSCWMAF
jgi:hypothetical protein